ncbi:MAG TPA: MOSC N-terminal beta barrel domain-containing protein [Gemmatimonadales bacterium]|nr:MOSC N-terminal beta barrel domain-containing protein [Gemmatimonadales bacterium]
MGEITLSAMNVYPIKSCAGTGVAEWEVDRFGLKHDRRWMVITAEGEFLTQRDVPAMALIKPRIAGIHLRVNAPEMPELVLPLEPQGGRPVATRVWEDRLQVIAPDHRADGWISQVMGRECQLVYMPPDYLRPVDATYAPDGGQASFADGFPFLLAGEASLADLNRRLLAPLPMNRFRPNLVVRGSEPWAEDTWAAFSVGGIPMQGVKLCARCVVTTTEQNTGQRDGQEPLRTLATFRKHARGVMFGQNVVHYGVGRLKLGDKLVVERSAPSR